MKFDEALRLLAIENGYVFHGSGNAIDEFDKTLQYIEVSLSAKER